MRPNLHTLAAAEFNLAAKKVLHGKQVEILSCGVERSIVQDRCVQIVEGLKKV